MKVYHSDIYISQPYCFVSNEKYSINHLSGYQYWYNCVMPPIGNISPLHKLNWRQVPLSLFNGKKTRGSSDFKFS